MLFVSRLIQPQTLGCHSSLSRRSEALAVATSSQCACDRLRGSALANCVALMPLQFSSIKYIIVGATLRDRSLAVSSAGTQKKKPSPDKFNFIEFLRFSILNIVN